MPDLEQIMDALAGRIQTELCGTANPLIENLQVTGRMHFNPTPPSVDIYPSDPFQEPLAFGTGNNTVFLTVRARVSTADHEGGQELLLSMMDPGSSTSMIQAVATDRTLGSVVKRATVVEGPSSFGVFPDSGGGGNLLGCTWRVQVTP